MMRPLMWIGLRNVLVLPIVADLFEDTEDGGCHLYSHDSESLIIRPKDL